MSLSYRIGWVVIVALAGVGCEVLQLEKQIRCECTNADGNRAFCEVARTEKDTKVSPP